MKERILNTINLIEYVSRPMKKEDVLLLYRVNNVTPERTELYLDFVKSLFKLVTSTYLGDDIMDDKEIKKHFNWCWSKVLNNFRKEHIYFDDNVEMYSYFNSLFTEFFYQEEDKSESNIKELMNFWVNSFKYEPIKTRSELETFFDLYKLFDKSIHV
jgi:hypothetical protein|tara:strand:- start:3511 stop:3981 length:471 start_codon:yes stop_codon:yes gene_type:complete